MAVVIGMCSVKKTQNAQENLSARVSFLIKLEAADQQLY